MRGFYYVKDEFAKNSAKSNGIPLPRRGSYKSAGYDFFSPIQVTLAPGEFKVIWTDVKAGMQSDEKLDIYPRSGKALNPGLVIRNTIGLIDSDYFENESNDGNIGIAIWNIGDTIAKIDAGDKIAQGVFSRYLTVENEVEEMDKRAGGFGSTGK